MQASVSTVRKTRRRADMQFSLVGLLRFMTLCCLLSAGVSAVMAYPEILHIVGVYLVFAAGLLVLTFVVWIPVVLVIWVLVKTLCWLSPCIAD